MLQMIGVEFLRRVKCEHFEAIRLIFTTLFDAKAGRQDVEEMLLEIPPEEK